MATEPKVIPVIVHNPARFVPQPNSVSKAKKLAKSRGKFAYSYGKKAGLSYEPIPKGSKYRVVYPDGFVTDAKTKNPYSVYGSRVVRAPRAGRKFYTLEGAAPLKKKHKRLKTYGTSGQIWSLSPAMKKSIARQKKKRNQLLPSLIFGDLYETSKKLIKKGQRKLSAKPKKNAPRARRYAPISYEGSPLHRSEKRLGSLDDAQRRYAKTKAWGAAAKSIARHKRKKKNPTMFAFPTFEQAKAFAASRPGKHKIWAFGNQWVVRKISRNPHLAIVSAAGNPNPHRPPAARPTMSKQAKKNSHLKKKTKPRKNPGGKKVSSRKKAKRNSTAARPRAIIDSTTPRRHKPMAKRKSASGPRKNPARKKSRKGTTRRNPNVTGFITRTPWLEIGKVTAGVVLGTNLVRVIPQLVLGDKNQGTLGHAANIATGILLTSVGVGIDKTFGVALGAGALGGYTNRIVQDAWDTVAPYAGISGRGLGDKMFSGLRGYANQDSRYEQGWPIQTRQPLPTPVQGVAGVGNATVFNAARRGWAN